MSLKSSVSGSGHVGVILTFEQIKGIRDVPAMSLVMSTGHVCAVSSYSLFICPSFRFISFRFVLFHSVSFRFFFSSFFFQDQENVMENDEDAILVCPPAVLQVHVHFLQGECMSSEKKSIPCYVLPARISLVSFFSPSLVAFCKALRFSGQRRPEFFESIEGSRGG